VTDRALAVWLERLEQRAPESHIELGLDRVREVYGRLPIASKPPAVITVGGTNGKGSVVAYLEAMALAAGHSTFAYTSPHLIDFTERFRIDGQRSDEQAVAEAIASVEQVRDEVFLTYFEHITLAAWVLASRAGADLWILEVGLGGRLDAVNLIDSDVAVITSIGLDHTEWLGPTRLDVGREKAGIARAGRPLVFAESSPPIGMGKILEDSGAKVWRRGHEFRSRRRGNNFQLRWSDQRMLLPLPIMTGRWQQSNASAAALAAILIRSRIAIDNGAIAQGLMQARIAGRLDVVSRAPEIILDVAHNPAAARALAGYLRASSASPTIAVFAALTGKDVVAIGRALRATFKHWLLAPLADDRALAPAEIAARLEKAAVTGSVDTLESVAQAVDEARRLAGSEGRVVVFGSFRTVAEAWPLFQSH